MLSALSASRDLYLPDPNGPNWIGEAPEGEDVFAWRHPQRVRPPYSQESGTGEPLARRLRPNGITALPNLEGLDQTEAFGIRRSELPP